MSIEQDVAARLLTLQQNFIQFHAQATGEFTQRIENLEMGKITTPDYLHRPEDREQSRERIKAYRECFEEYKEYMQSYIVNFAEQLKQCADNLPPEKQQEIMGGFATGLQVQINSQHELYKIRGAWLDALEELLNVFDSMRGDAYVSEDGDLFFEDENDLADYNNKVDMVNQAALAEQAWNKARIERVTASMDRLYSKN
jgi:hypothetical protein